MATFTKARPTSSIDEDTISVMVYGPPGARQIRLQADSSDGKNEIDETYQLTASQVTKRDGTALASYDPATTGSLAQKLRQFVRAVLADKGYVQA